MRELAEVSAMLTDSQDVLERATARLRSLREAIETSDPSPPREFQGSTDDAVECIRIMARRRQTFTYDDLRSRYGDRNTIWNAAVFLARKRGYLAPHDRSNPGIRSLIFREGELSQ